jgi:predicted  nucleic acid-binding Zn-ribbon protein
MNSLQTIELQKALENLNRMLDLWVPLLNEIKKMKQEIEQLPQEVSRFKGKIDLLKLELSLSQQEEQRQAIAKLQNCSPKLQQLGDNLALGLTQILEIEKKIGNMIALRERIEALQESLATSQTCDR